MVNHFAADLGIPRESRTPRIGIRRLTFRSISAVMQGGRDARTVEGVYRRKSNAVSHTELSNASVVLFRLETCECPLPLSVATFFHRTALGFQRKVARLGSKFHTEAPRSSLHVLVR